MHKRWKWACSGNHIQLQQHQKPWRKRGPHVRPTERELSGWQAAADESRGDGWRDEGEINDMKNAEVVR